MRQGTMDKENKVEKIDNLVKRVTVIQGSGDARRAEAIYEKDVEQEEGDDEPGVRLQGLERGLRHLLKAQLVGVQEAYQGHLHSVEKGGLSWITEAPGNLIRAGRKAFREIRKVREDDDEKED
jgi:hypothetical protein